MPKSSTRKKSPAQIIAGARRPEEKVTICLRGDVIREIEALEDQLAQIAKDKAPAQSLGGAEFTDEERAIAARVAELKQEADENSIDLLIRALPRNEWRQIAADNPANEEDAAKGWVIDVDNAAYAALTASVVSPELDADTLLEMADGLAEGQWRKIRDGVLNANGGDGSVPFTQRALLIRRLSSSADESPEPIASASDSSTAGSPGRGRRSPSGSTDSPQPG